MSIKAAFRGNKKGSICQKLSDTPIWVIEGARTPDPQNHNLML